LRNVMDAPLGLDGIKLALLAAQDLIKQISGGLCPVTPLRYQVDQIACVVHQSLSLTAL